MLTYCVTAAALGAGWFVVLLIPGVTRGWLLENGWQNLAFLIVSSVLVAVMCRRFIARADGLRDHLFRAAVLPLLGCFVFLTLWNAWIWIGSHGVANIHDTLSLYLMGMAAAVWSFFVVGPYGLLCERIMNALAPQ